MRISRNMAVIISASIYFLLSTACDSNPASSDPDEGQIKISIKSIDAANPGVPGKRLNGVTSTSARIVIEKIKFKGTVEDSMDFELKNPFVQDLLAGANLHEITTVDVPFGTYEEMEIKIDELDETQSVAYSRYPERQNLSIRIAGHWDNNVDSTFVFTSDLSEEQAQEFNPPLTLDETRPATNLVLTLDMASWFVDRSGNPLDPALSENRSRIEENIKSSFSVFEDEDDNGEDDHDY